jgi:hypothetical protein
VREGKQENHWHEVPLEWHRVPGVIERHRQLRGKHVFDIGWQARVPGLVKALNTSLVLLYGKQPHVPDEGQCECPKFFGGFGHAWLLPAAGCYSFLVIFSLALLLASYICS